MTKLVIAPESTQHGHGQASLVPHMSLSSDQEAICVPCQKINWVTGHRWQDRRVWGSVFTTRAQKYDSVTISNTQDAHIIVW